MNDWKRFLPVLMLLVLALNACATFNMLLPGISPTAVPSLTPTFTVTTTPSPTLPPTPTALLLPTTVRQNSPTQTPAPTLPADVTATPTRPPKTLFDEYIPGHEQVAETEHFVFRAAGGYFPVNLDRWQEQAEVIYAYVAERVEAESEEKIWLAFDEPQDQACPIRGLASRGDPPMILIFADETYTEDYLFAVLAHEVGHAIPSEGFPGGLPNDLALTEGLATWAAGDYWDAWKDQPSLHALVRSYVEAGVYLPLHQTYTLPDVYPWQEGADENCLARRDILYSQWGSFVGYIVEQYGWEKAHQLFESARSESQEDQIVDYPTDYPGVLGKALNQLEVEWLDFVMQAE